MQAGLFDSKKPLAEELRPDGFENFFGQEKAVARVKAFLASRRLPSVLFYGPPGCGKSSLALIMAKKSGLPFARLSAPEASVSSMREIITKNRILVLDEIHRFSKAQQDFFLPIIERGNLTLLASTTENPSFTVTRQLLSRMHVIHMESLSMDAMRTIATRGSRKEKLGNIPGLVDFICKSSDGDARTLMSLIELASSIPNVSLEKMKELMPERMIRHDRDGDNHYELISALIKSIRGSDVDAALYWLGALIAGGEDPIFICRRLAISASEDIGLADPTAISVASSCLSIVERIGMPEGRIPMAETAAYLALAPKSNSAYKALDRALAEIHASGVKPVPFHLRNAVTKLQQEEGYHEGYLYPHDYENGWVNQQYLPDDVPLNYEPCWNGAEKQLVEKWEERRNPENSESPK